MANTRSKHPAVKPVIEPVAESEPVKEEVIVTEPEPVFKPVMVRVKALGWYNNGILLDKPWLTGEVRIITLDLYKRLKNDLPDNWETF